MRSGFVWDTDPETAFTGLYDQYSVLVVSTVFLICESYAPQIESWMKRNAPWTDRTGNARQTLNVPAPQLMADAIVVWLRHGMEYGYWLETRWAGRYAIIGPAMDYFVPRIMADIQRVLA